MSSDFVLSITTKDTPKQKNPIHVVMWEGTDGTQELLERISHLEKAIHKLTERQSSIFFPTALYPTPCGIEVKSRSNSFTNEFDLNVFRTVSKVSGSDAGDAIRPEEEEEEVDIDEIVNSMKEMDMEEDDRLEDEEDEEDEEEEEDDRVEYEEEDDAHRLEEQEQEQEQGELVETKEGEQEEAKEEEEQELQEAEEFKEFVWKGQTYYKDSENLVYQLDTDGDLIDTPIGIWKEETQKLVKYKAV